MSLSDSVTQFYKSKGSLKNASFVAQRLRRKFDSFIEQLSEYSLIINYKPSSDASEQQNHGLVRHMHEAIMKHLINFGYSFVGAEKVPNAPAMLDWVDVPWRIVWYSATKPNPVQFLSDESRTLPLPGVDIPTLKRSPFGHGSTRPKIEGDPRDVLLISKFTIAFSNNY